MTAQTCETCRFSNMVNLVTAWADDRTGLRCTRYPPHPRHGLPRPMIGMGCGEWAAKPEDEA